MLNINLTPSSLTKSLLLSVLVVLFPLSSAAEDPKPYREGTVKKEDFEKTPPNPFPVEDGVFDFFANAGLPIKKSGGDREYVGKVKGLANADVVFMSSSEIAGAAATTSLMS